MADYRFEKQKSIYLEQGIWSRYIVGLAYIAVTAGEASDSETLYL
jgi:hypothetical protein